MKILIEKELFSSSARIFPGMRYRPKLSDAIDKARAEKIVNAASEYFEVKAENVKGVGRYGKLPLCRFISYKLIKETTRMTLTEIADFFGRDHTCVIRGLQTLKNLMDTEEKTKNDFKAVEEALERSNGVRVWRIE